MADPQKITSQEFLKRYRAQYASQIPEGMSDAVLLNKVLTKYPKYRAQLLDQGQMVGNAQISGPATGTARFKEGLYGAAETGLDALPPALAAIIAAVGGETPPTAVAGAGLGALAGSYLKNEGKQLIFPPSKGYAPQKPIEELSDIEKDTLTNMGFEGVGRFLGAPALKALKNIELPENQAILNISREFGLGLTQPQVVPTPKNIARLSMFPRSSAVPRLTMEAGDEAILKRAGQRVGNLPEIAFGREAANAAPDISGRIIQKDITGVGNPAFDARVDKLNSLWNIRARNIRVAPGTVSTLKQDLQNELNKAAVVRNQLSTIPDDPNKLLEPTARTRQIYEDILKLPNDASVINLNKLRSRLMQETRNITDPISGEALGQAKHFVGKITDIIDESVKGTPAESAWKSFNNYYRKGVEAFNAKQTVQMLEADPEKLTKAIGPQDITAALRARRAITGYAQKSGTPDQKALAESAWNRFRAQWINQHVFTGDINGLSGRLKAVDPRVMRTLIGHDPEGQELIRNATRLGAAIDRVTRLQGEGANQMLRYAIYRLGYHVGTGVLPGMIGAIAGGLSHGGVGIGLGATAGVLTGEFGGAVAARALAKVLYNPQTTERAIRAITFLARNPVLTNANAMRALDQIIESPETPVKKEQQP